MNRQRDRRHRVCLAEQGALGVGGQQRREYQLALDKRLANHTAANWLFSGALRTTPGYRGQYIAIGPVQDLADRATVAAQHIDHLRRDLVEGMGGQCQQRLHLGQIAEAAKQVEALGLRVSGQGVGDPRPMRPVRQSVAIKARSTDPTARQAEQQAGPAHHTFVSGEDSLKKKATPGATVAISARLGDQRPPKGGAIDHQKPLLAHRRSVGHRHKGDARDHGRLDVSLAVNRDALTEGHQLADPRLVHAEEREAERAHRDMRGVILLLSHQFELPTDHDQHVGLATPTPRGGDVAHQLRE